MATFGPFLTPSRSKLGTRPAGRPLHNFRTKRSANFMKAGNVEQPIFKLQKCKRVGRENKDRVRANSSWFSLLFRQSVCLSVHYVMLYIFKLVYIYISHSLTDTHFPLTLWRPTKCFPDKSLHKLRKVSGKQITMASKALYTWANKVLHFIWAIFGSLWSKSARICANKLYFTSSCVRGFKAYEVCSLLSIIKILLLKHRDSLFKFI